MLQQAISKLRSEMTQNNANAYIQVVGDFLLQHLEQNPQDAEKILSKDKCIAKSLDEMRKVAGKKKIGNCAVLTDQEGFSVVLKYFNIKGRSAAPVNSIAPTPVPEPTKPTINFDVRLEDLL
jgi:hypothetical protein